jgi:hypothetical protein
MQKDIPHRRRAGAYALLPRADPLGQLVRAALMRAARLIVERSIGAHERYLMAEIEIVEIHRRGSTA